TKKSVFEQEQDKYDDIEEQIRKCIINSPQDGMVVYYISDQSRYGSGSQQSIIAQGETVREGQKLMRIPDLRHMLVNTKVHEALVSRVRGETSRAGFLEGLSAALGISPDPLSRLAAQCALVEKHEQFHAPGQTASVRVDAF